MRSRDSLERRIGFDAEMNQNFPGLRTLPSLETYGDEERAERLFIIRVMNNPDLIGVYVLSSEARVPLTILNDTMNTDHLIKIAHERTPSPKRHFEDGSWMASLHKIPAILSAAQCENSRRSRTSVSQKVHKNASGSRSCSGQISKKFPDAITRRILMT